MNDLPLPEPNQSRRIAVIGAGFMGAVIATLYAHSGYRVVLCDSQQRLLDDFAQRAAPIADALVASGEAARLLTPIEKTTSLEAASSDCLLVQETVQEDLAVKQALFAQFRSSRSRGLSTSSRSINCRYVASRPCC